MYLVSNILNQERLRRREDMKRIDGEILKIDFWTSHESSVIGFSACFFFSFLFKIQQTTETTCIMVLSDSSRFCQVSVSISEHTHTHTHAHTHPQYSQNSPGYSWCVYWLDGWQGANRWPRPPGRQGPQEWLPHPSATKVCVCSHYTGGSAFCKFHTCTCRLEQALGGLTSPRFFGCCRR